MLAFLRLLAWSFISAAIAIAALGGAGYWLYQDATVPGPLAAARTLVIPPHTGLAGIADLLARLGVVRHGVTFEVMAKLSARGAALKPGEYEFPAATSALQALDIIASGRTVKHWLTVPEGLTSPEVVALVRDAPALIGDAGPTPPEGSLLPDTYLYGYGDSRKAVIARMQHAMAHVVAEMWRRRERELPLASPQQAVILASIVEKETAREEERPHIAGVYLNRLRLGMRLQADPTVLFALGADGATKPDRKLSRADLSFSSPYNTYLVKGLPPGPIANPSRASLRAATRPERTEDLYFVADDSGGHIFAKTLAEQTRNITQYQRGSALAPEALPPIAAVAQQVPAAAGPQPEKTRRIAQPAAAAARLHRRHLAQHAARSRRCRREAGRPCPPRH